MLTPHQQKREGEGRELHREVPRDGEPELLEPEEQPVDVETRREDVGHPGEGENDVPGEGEGVRDVEGTHDGGGECLEAVDAPELCREPRPVPPDPRDAPVAVVVDPKHGEQDEVVGHRVSVGVLPELPGAEDAGEVWGGHQR